MVINLINAFEQQYNGYPYSQVEETQTTVLCRISHIILYKIKYKYSFMEIQLLCM